MKNYGEYLKNWRIENKKTLLEVQNETGISNQNLSRWERGDVLPNIDFCVQLADYYGISIDELIGRELPTEKDRIKKKPAQKQTININQTYNF